MRTRTATTTITITIVVASSLCLCLFVGVGHAANKSVDEQWTSDFRSSESFENDWRVYTGKGAWSSANFSELQLYTRDSIRLNSNNMQIVTSYNGLDEYTSGRVTSRKSFKYGTFEIRARMPHVSGLWSYVWLLPDKPNIIWPDDGEINIVEHFGDQLERIHAAIHCRKHNSIDGDQKHSTVQVSGLSDSFHIFKLVWKPDSISIFVDGLQYLEYTKNALDGVSYDYWPFDKEFRLAIGTTVISNHGPIQHWRLPQNLTVDWVRYTPIGLKKLVPGSLEFNKMKMAWQCDIVPRVWFATKHEKDPLMCIDICRNTTGCTHFTYSMFNSGTCFLRAGKFDKKHTIIVSDLTMACGYL